MNLKVGQKVLCILDHYRSYCSYPVKKGSIYTIHGYYECPCGSQQVTLKEIIGVTNMGCKCNLTSYRRQSYYTWRFIPLNYFEIFKSLSWDKKEFSKEINVENGKQFIFY